MDSTPYIADKKLTGRRYWKSLDDLAQTPAFDEWLHREFPQGAAEAEGVNRRDFVKIMSASFALAGFGLSGCRQPEQKIVPYSKQPENMIPGVAKYFASSMPSAKGNIPVAVETHSARPTKIEGNSNYKPYGGATTTYAQSSVLDLYDADRAMTSSTVANGIPTPVTKAAVNDRLAQVATEYSTTNGEGLAFLLDASTSVSRDKLLKELSIKFPKALFAHYEPLDTSVADRCASELYGVNVRPLYKFAKAKRIVSFDADFTNVANENIAYARDFASSRRVQKASEAEHMSRLYMVESNFTITGGMADHRLRLASSNIPAFMALLAAAILRKTGGDVSLAVALEAKTAKLNIEKRDAWISACADDLIAHKGSSLVVAGEHLSTEAQQLALFINEKLGAVGHTLEYVQADAPSIANIETLAEAIRKKSISTLIIFGGNPAYNAPADLEWKKLQAGVPHVLRFSTHFDETALASTFHISATHYLESWSDGRTADGTYVPVQPMIFPLYESIMELEVLARLAGSPVTDAYEIVKATFATLNREADVQKAFNVFLNRGYLPKSEFPVAIIRTKTEVLKKAIARLPAAVDGFSAKNLEVRIIPSAQVHDGRYANNAWLQEMPEPMNKTAWENTINISPRLAKELGFNPVTARWMAVSAVTANTHQAGHQEAPIGKLTVNGVTLQGPVNIQPGLANYTVTVTMGYGRTHAGRVADGIGFDAFPIFKSDTKHIVTNAVLEITSATVEIANTQQHWSMEGRDIIREANVEEYIHHPDFVDHIGMESHTPPVYGKDKDKSLAWKVKNQPRGGSAYETPVFGGDQQWGMSIDLNTCTGCNLCVIACQSENSIPVVGKQQVIRGREMHWIRLDRYYSSGDMHANQYHIPEDPQVSVQPMGCQHCEMAPCEQVCPVNATVHDSQGLNVMAYNRCVGTRYCANNCPYKVRRFNFFDWNKRETDQFYLGPLGINVDETEKGKLRAMQHNPDVTVRMRGVMEKCTYCTQRIETAKINQKVVAKDSANVLIPDGAIKTACQQACPTGSIVFGDVADEKTEVYKVKQSDRDYSVLGYLNIRPRTTYLARLRNPNKNMPDYQDKPFSLKEYHQASGH